MSVIHSISIEYRYAGYTHSKTVKLPLALVTVVEGCSVLTPDFIIPVVNSFTLKIPSILWDINFTHLLLCTAVLYVCGS